MPLKPSARTALAIVFMLVPLASPHPVGAAPANQAANTLVIDTTAEGYYGKGYQDVQNRVPKIANTCADLEWRPKVTMDRALSHIFDAYRGDVAEARALVD